MTTPNSQQSESFLPVYDYIPETWQEARISLVEFLKQISNAVNVREIGFYLNEAVIAGKLFYPSANNNQIFRTIFRNVIETTGIVSGNNTFPHGLTIDVNFTLIDLWAAASNSTTFVGTPINGTGNAAAGRAGVDITYDATNIYILSNGTYDRCNIIIEYLLEI